MIARARRWLADQVAARLADPLAGARRSRAEAFGAIVQLTRPRALVFVDRDRARSLGLDGGAAWRDPARDGGALPDQRM